MPEINCSVVSASLDSGCRETLNKWLFTQLALLKSIANGDARGSELIELVHSLVRNLPASLVISQATPFFWNNVIRAHLATQARPHELLPALYGIAAAAVDCFLGQQPEGTEVMLSLPVKADGYCFPCNGQRLMLNGPSRIQCVKGRLVSLDDERNQSPACRVTLPIPAHADIKLVLANDRQLFDDSYRHQIVPNTPHAVRLAEMIGESLRLIEKVSAPLRDRIRALVKWYIPICSPTVLVHNSFSASTLYGAIFLSDAYSPVRLAEAIVHEFHHNELYMLMAVEDVIDEVPTELFYSPWRQDPRPLSALLHALHVFANVKRFLMGIIERDLFPNDSEALYERCSALSWKLRIGLEQLPLHRLHLLGTRLIADVRAIAQSGFDRISNPPSEILSHIRHWKEAHPSLPFREIASNQLLSFS